MSTEKVFRVGGFYIGQEIFAPIQGQIVKGKITDWDFELDNLYIVTCSNGYSEANKAKHMKETKSEVIDVLVGELQTQIDNLESQRD